jgi:ABC-type molybdate transport system substrate-binding protein
MARFMLAAVAFMLAPPALHRVAGAIVANARQPAAVKALLDFLAAPETIKVMKAKGLEPAS